MEDLNLSYKEGKLVRDLKPIPSILD